MLKEILEKKVPRRDLSPDRFCKFVNTQSQTDQLWFIRRRRDGQARNSPLATDRPKPNL